MPLPDQHSSTRRGHPRAWVPQVGRESPGWTNSVRSMVGPLVGSLLCSRPTGTTGGSGGSTTRNLAVMRMGEGLARTSSRIWGNRVPTCRAQALIPGGGCAHRRTRSGMRSDRGSRQGADLPGSDPLCPRPTRGRGQCLPAPSDPKGWWQPLEAVRPSGAQAKRQAGGTELPQGKASTGPATLSQGNPFIVKAEGNSWPLLPRKPVVEIDK